MIIVRSLDDYEARNDLLLTIGVFDGVHLGHRAILSRLANERRGDARVAALTFEHHPEELLAPEHAPKAITTADEKINLLDRCGLDALFLLPFDQRMQSTGARTFLEEVLVARMRTRALVVGQEWRFGRDREGTTQLAAELLPPLGCRFEAVPLLEHRGERVSSSRIRALIEERNFELADELLGEPYEVSGIVVAGDGRGHSLGFPTANLATPPGKLLPPSGVFAATARFDGRDVRAVVSIGDKPTFGGGHEVLEAYLLDFDESIYGRQLVLRRWRFIRDQVKYSEAAALVEQIERDVATARTMPM